MNQETSTALSAEPLPTGLPPGAVRTGTDWHLAKPAVIPFILVFGLMFAVSLAVFAIALSTPVDILPAAEAGT